ncbi:MAG: sialidase family protein [Bacteroidia bacterium]
MRIKLLSFFMLSVALGGCGKESMPIPEPKPPVVPTTGNNSYNHIFKSNEGGYYCFRIPAIIKTKAGTLLAFAEARKNNCGDEGDIDMVVKRSTDKGKTWSALSVIWTDGDNTCGNPAPVVDQNTGKIHLLMTWNLGTDDISTINNGTSKDTRRVYKTSSVDDGNTWARPQEITADVKLAAWGWYATGPCHGIQISKGQYQGRLVIPCDNIETGAGRKGYSHVIYSDNNGETWKLGGVTPPISVNPNESTVAELSDGSLMLNMRVANNNNLRMKSISTDGGLTWSVPTSAVGLVDPVCQGSLVSSTIAAQHTLFFSNASSITRTNMTIKMSIDNGLTWPKALSVYTGMSAYSDMVMIETNEIGLLYEAGVSRFSDGIAFRNVNVTEIK